MNPFIKSKKSRINLHLPGREKPYVMAHRGNKVAFPENTMSAFRQALQDGADLIETDLHLSADDVFMCIHDGTIDRTTDGSGAVAEMSLSELKKFNAAAARPELPPEPIPTLRDLAEILPADIGLALELKTDRFLEAATCRRLAQELEQLGLKARTVVLSFSLTRLDTLRLVAPDLPVGWITLSKIWPIWGVEMIGPFWPLLFLNPFMYCMLISASRSSVRLIPSPIHASGITVSCDATPSSQIIPPKRAGCWESSMGGKTKSTSRRIQINSSRVTLWKIECRTRRFE